jgi:hypothetical protein
VSAFLARLAARAVGQVRVAQPWVPSPFEAASEPGASPHAPEAIDDEVAVGPESPVTRATAPGSAAPAHDANSWAVSSAASSPTAAQATGDPAAERPEPARSGPRQGATGRTGPRRPRTVVSDQVAPDERPGVLASDTPPVPQTSLIVSAVPLSAATPVASRSANEATRSASPSAPEPPAVRVHIGRLEIRANLPESAPARPPARLVREEAARGVSLADYLRGAR